MGIKDVLRNTVTPEPDTADIDAALAEVGRCEKQITEIDARGTRLLSQQANTEEAIGRTEDDDKATVLVDKVADLEKQRKVNDARRKAAVEDLAKAKAVLHRLGVDKQLKVHRRNTNALVKTAEEMQAHLEAFAASYKKYFEQAEKIRLSLPQEYSLGGMLLTADDFLPVLTLEKWRVLPVHPLAAPTGYPPLPGSRFPIIGNANVDTMPKMLEAVKEAAAHIIRKVSEGPAPLAGEQPAPQAKPIAAQSASPPPSMVDARTMPVQHQKLSI